MSESFDGAIVLAQAMMADCDKPILNSLQIAHERDMELADKSAYNRGHHDGQRSMDAEHYAVVLKLRRLCFDGDSHANLSKIAYAIYPCATGWTCESCDGLRDELIRLMGGVHECGADCGGCGAGCADCDCGAGESRRVMYDELGSERHKAVCELRKLPDDIVKSELMYEEAEHMIYAALGVEKELLGFYEGLNALRDRLIHLLGGDERDSQKSPILADSDGEDGGEVTITADLRERVNTATKTYDDTPWHELGDGSEADHTICHITEGELLRVADRIDEWFKRLCEQQEAVLQKTINDLIDERNKLQRELSEQKSCAEGFAQTTQAKWYEEQVLKLERELAEVRGAVDRARDGWAKTDEEKCELQAKLDAIRSAIGGTDG